MPVKEPGSMTIADMGPLYRKWHSCQKENTVENDLRILRLLSNEKVPISKMSPDEIQRLANKYQDNEPGKTSRKTKIKSVLDKVVKTYNAEFKSVAYHPTVKKGKKPEAPIEPDNLTGVSIDDILGPAAIEPLLEKPLKEDVRNNVYRAITRTYNQLRELRSNPNDDLYKLLFNHLQRLIAKEWAILSN